MLTLLKGVGEVTKKKLNALGIFTRSDLLFRPPIKYIDLDGVSENFTDGEYCKLSGRVTSKSLPIRKGALQMFRLNCSYGNKKFAVLWFNQNYSAKNFTEGNDYIFFGKIKFNSKNSFEFINPQYEKYSENSKFTGILPVYYTKGLIPQGTYREIVKSALEQYTDGGGLFSAAEEAANGMLPLGDGLRYQHLPSGMLAAEKGRERVVLELTARRLAAFNLEKDFFIPKKERVYSADTGIIREFISSLPYTLTETQRSTADGLVKALSSPYPLNAIVCGDVGSGKTVIAAILILFAVKSGYQAAFLAPTELLALQHYKLLCKLLSPFGVTAGVVYSGMGAAEKKEVLLKIKDGSVHAAVGTHSLLSEKVEFHNLAFAAADEQHRFGVAQRTGLLEKGTKTDFLTLSATPIPRSMQLIAYGNIDYYTIEKRYEGNVITKIIAQDKLSQMLSFIAGKCSEGKQAFIVLPKIEDSEGCETFSAKSFYESVKDKEFAGIPSGIMHGKLSEKEKRLTMERFNSKEISVLVSTTVIEVGIDVQNASVIAVMNAERFGLATLHQLRGRVGRDGGTAYCFLHTAQEDNPRLNKIRDCADGFELAEYDFSVRGGGNIFGTEQKGGGGIPGLTFDIIKKAGEIISTSDLARAEPLLRAEAERFYLKDISMN